ncbi:Cystine-binding periplasmic protein precursor [compost metagenome]
MSFNLSCLLILLFCLEGSFAHAAKPLRIATFPIPLMVESESKGIFISLTREIAKRSKVEVQIEVWPTAKTLLDFSTNKVDAFFPALEVFAPKQASRTASFYTKVDFVFSTKGKNLNTLKDLEGKKVGLTFRYPYVKELTQNKKIDFEFADDDVTNMKKLALGTIDAFVVEERSGLQALSLSGQTNIQYNKDKPLSKQDVFYAFQDNEEGKGMVELFNRAIESMRKDGTFDRLMNQDPSKN